MPSLNTGIAAAFIMYLAGMMFIGVLFYRRMDTLSAYILGSRSLGAWVASLSAEASDMSGWLMLGLPGYAYAAGMNAGWIALGLIIGTYVNWKFIAGRLRSYTQIAHDSLTVPDYLENRFHDDSRILRIGSSVFILIFFLVYTASGFVAGGKLFTTVFGLPYFWALLIGATVVIFYTFLGGFMAVCWTDFVQGVLMFFAILIVPIMGIALLGGPGRTAALIAGVNRQLLNPFTSPDGAILSPIAILSLMAWGLGYFGQPHILIRFMAIKSVRQISPARQIAMVWVTLTLSAAVAVGLVGRVFLPTVLSGPSTETVFMIMSNTIFYSFLAGIILSGILAAIMSTASAQLLVTASAISQDLYKQLFHHTADEKELLRVSRGAVILVALAAIMLALNPNNMVLDLVAYAWAGFGATFGPVIVLSLFWKRMTRYAALSGIIAGGATVLIWKQYGWLGLYEIIPGFLLAALVIVAVSLLDKAPSAEIQREFERNRLRLLR